MPFRATFDCLWCGTAHVPRPRRHRRLGAACPTCIGKAGDNGFLRFRLRDAITERGRSGVHVPAGTRPTTANVADADLIAYYEARAPNTTTGTCAGVATLAARSTTPPGTPSSTARVDGSTRCRSRGRSSSSRPAPAGGRRCLPARANCRSTTRPRRRWTAPGTGCWPMGSAPTSTPATRGPSRIGRVDALFAGFWLSHVERAACRRSSRSRAAGSARAARSRSSTRSPTRNRARNHRRPPTTVRSGGSTTAASSRSSRSTTRRKSRSQRCARLVRRCRGLHDRPVLRSRTGHGLEQRRPWNERTRPMLRAMSPLEQRTIATIGSGVMARP